MALFTSNITPAMNIAQASQTSTNLTIAPGDFNRPTNQDFHEHNGEVHRRGSAWRCGFVVPHLDLSKISAPSWRFRWKPRHVWHVLKALQSYVTSVRGSWPLYFGRVFSVGGPENVTHRNPALRRAGPPRSLPQPIRPWWQSSRISRIVLETRAWRPRIWSPHAGSGVKGGWEISRTKWRFSSLGKSCVNCPLPCWWHQGG